MPTSEDIIFGGGSPTGLQLPPTSPKLNIDKKPPNP